MTTPPQPPSTPPTPPLDSASSAAVPTPPAPQQPMSQPLAQTGPDAPMYRDDDLVYVDPDTRTVVGRVQWSRNGNPKSMAYQPVERTPTPAPAPRVEKPVDGKVKEPREERRRFMRKNYPWGTYRSMKRAYKLEGKKRVDPNKKLDEILEKALKEPFWD